DADQDAACAVILDERHLLRVEEAQGLLGTKMPGEAVKKGSLILMVLNPIGLEPHQLFRFGFTFGLHVKRMLLTELGRLIVQHPREWDGCCRVRRVPQRSWREVPVGTVRTTIVGVILGLRVLERGHETAALLDAARPLFLWQLLQRPAGDGFLSGVIAVL